MSYVVGKLYDLPVYEIRGVLFTFRLDYFSLQLHVKPKLLPT